MSGLRERLDDDITAAFRQYESYHYARQAGIVNIAADAALATFRQWLADQGLVCVPKKCTDDDSPSRRTAERWRFHGAPLDTRW